ncbi:MAG TPA: glycoside hydrolase family 28 protein [Vicinamibacterales bacterium]|jgi:polygalacturonase
MQTTRRLSIVPVLFLVVPVLVLAAAARPSASRAHQAVAPPAREAGFDVRAYGAKGDGKALDTDAINRAIDAAAAAGGGTVRLPSGAYRSFSIHLKSHVGLFLDQGATLVAAEPNPAAGEGYDAPEPLQWDMYQDFGHSHWHNSLIWGEGIEDVSITGPGTIWGKGLIRNQSEKSPVGTGNKAISLRNCRNVLIRDVSILHGGHFGILATGVDNLTIDNMKIDTNRDGIDVDACRNVRLSNLTVNSPFDDGICLKSSYGLGVARATENVTITNCQVSGYDEGSLLDGTYTRKVEYRRGPTGRIKFGTESNGGFKNITISNCVFDYSRGLAIESVDGAIIEDVAITNITMRDIVSAPIFVRLGSRARGPNNPPTGAIRRVRISNVVASNVSDAHGVLVSGVPGHPVEDLRLSDIRIAYRGGGTKADAALEPPEKENAYPEPDMFGRTPSYGLYVRHAVSFGLREVELSVAQPDARPAVRLEDVSGADLDAIKVARTPGEPTFVLRQVKDFLLRNSPGFADARRPAVVRDAF